MESRGVKGWPSMGNPGGDSGTAEVRGTGQSRCQRQQLYLTLLSCTQNELYTQNIISTHPAGTLFHPTTPPPTPAPYFWIGWRM